jgi:hypothetical protein
VPASQQFMDTGPIALVDDPDGETSARDERPEAAARQSRPIDVVPETPDYASSAAISLRPRRARLLVAALLAAAALAGVGYLALDRGTGSSETTPARSTEGPSQEAAGSLPVTETREGEDSGVAAVPAGSTPTAQGDEVEEPPDPVPDATATDASSSSHKTKSAKHSAKKQPERAKDTSTAPPPPPVEPKKPPEEKWDQNSPFLPPSR